MRGPAIGAGACLAIAACDIRVAEPSTKIAFNFLKIGLHPGAISSQWQFPVAFKSFTCPSTTLKI